MFMSPLERIDNQIKELENLKKSYQQVPINNIITSQAQITPNNNRAEIKILNDGEDVMNIAISMKTIFIGENEIALKSPDGNLEKWSVKKIFPIDKKDQRINELENKLKEMEAKLNEYSKSTKSVQSSNEQEGISVITTKPTTKTSNK